MKKIIVLTGATGFVGKKLATELIKKGYDLRVVTRNISKAKANLPLPCSFHSWDGHSIFPSEILEETHALIHLAGEPIAQNRWTEEVKKEILASRSLGTKLVMSAVKGCLKGPKIVIGTSAIGIYGDRGDEILEEKSSHGKGFLTEVCQKWEEAYTQTSARLVLLRVGVVLGYGGALEKMLPPFRMGVGGILANGKQWMSWIHINDLVGLYIHSLENSFMNGSYNAVAPDTVTNSIFTKTLGKTLGRPTLFPVPSLAIKILFGEMSQVLLSSQRVSSKKTLAAGFLFKFPNLELAFKNLLQPLDIKGAHVFEAIHWIPNERKNVFSFFAEAQNLEKITPQWLNFRIKKLPQNGIYEGAMIDYQIIIHGIPVTWRTLISSWKPGESFVDQQISGPYKVWHHTHSFEDISDGTLMEDRVVYKLSFGLIGELVRLLMVKKDVEKIFKFRTQEINKNFPTSYKSITETSA